MWSNRIPSWFVTSENHSLVTDFGVEFFGAEVVSLGEGLHADKQKVSVNKHTMLHLVWRLMTPLLLNPCAWTWLGQCFG